MDVNHHGGYAFRLCKLPVGGNSELTEECFQQNHLDFVGDYQQYVYDREWQNGTKVVEVPTMRTREGTFPPNSQWTKSPVPHHDGNRGVHIFDSVAVPDHLEVGRYVLSFRWDCEETAQIWNVCANINIV